MEDGSTIWFIVHLASLALAYGTVIIVDLIGGLWLLGELGRERMLKITAWAQPVIWAGLVGMMISGALLGPDLTKPLTRVKMTLVILLAVNGLNLDALRKRTTQLSGQKFWDTPNSYKAWSVFSIALSQALWISIIVIAALNS